MAKIAKCGFLWPSKGPRKMLVFAFNPLISLIQWRTTELPNLSLFKVRTLIYSQILKKEEEVHGN